MKSKDESKSVVNGREQLNQPAERVGHRRDKGVTHELSSELNRDHAEAQLRPSIKYWIVELMDYGGTTPRATRDVVAEEEPDLYRAVGAERVLELCTELHRSRDSAQSEQYAVRFHQFNKEYFGGGLETYRIRAVYDGSFWINEHDNDVPRSQIDLQGKQIILGLTHCSSFCEMDRLLIHHMAHASTGTTADDDSRWVQEMKRLSDLGAPVFEWDL